MNWRSSLFFSSFTTTYRWVYGVRCRYASNWIAWMNVICRKEFIKLLFFVYVQFPISHYTVQASLKWFTLNYYYSLSSIIFFIIKIRRKAFMNTHNSHRCSPFVLLLFILLVCLFFSRVELNTFRIHRNWNSSTFFILFFFFFISPNSNTIGDEEKLITISMLHTPPSKKRRLKPQLKRKKMAKIKLKLTSTHFIPKKKKNKKQLAIKCGGERGDWSEWNKKKYAHLIRFAFYFQFDASFIFFIALFICFVADDFDCLFTSFRYEKK